jgi:hypothetical protein
VAAHILQLGAQLAHPSHHDAPVLLELCLARPAQAYPAGAAASGGAPRLEAAQPGEQVAVLGQRDLDAALARVGVLGKNVEDQAGAIDDAGVEGLGEVACLHWRKLVVEHDERGVQLGTSRGELCNLARANDRARVGTAQTLRKRAYHVQPGSVGQAAKLLQRGRDRPGIPSVGQLDPDQQGALPRHNVSGAQCSV